MLGKRKRDAVVVRWKENTSEETPSTGVAQSSASDVFKKYFEARFDPLPEPTPDALSLQEGRDQSEGSSTSERELDHVETDSEWSGLSEPTHSNRVVEVVDYAGVAQRIEDDPIERTFQKAFMGHKPPREVHANQAAGRSSTTKDEDEVEDKVNLKHDLDLQRLLRESHLLEQTKQKPDPGSKRHKATELRLQSLGSKVSTTSQERVPMSHRRGMLAKASSIDAHRRKEARENGIVLEKSTKKSSVSGFRRDRGVDVPVVGKFKGGTLQLSRKDVASIQGPRRSASGRGRGRGRGGGRRR